MKLKKLTALLLTVAVITAFMCISADARSRSNYYYTENCVTDEWTAFDETDPDNETINLTSAYDEPCAGDAGISTAKTSVGLTTAFVRSTSRTCELLLMEKDGWFNADDEVTYYYAKFYTTSAGKYRPENFTRNDCYDEPVAIENESGLEFYIKMWVEEISGDTSYNIPANLIQYYIWVD